MINNKEAETFYLLVCTASKLNRNNNNKHAFYDSYEELAETYSEIVYYKDYLINKYESENKNK